MAFHVPEGFRVTKGPLASTPEYGNYGAFHLGELWIIASEGEGWEHVSVHAQRNGGGMSYTPSWEQMCSVKSIFWDDEDCVMQLHPRRTEYVNDHDHTLHLWRPNTPGVVIPEPPSILVGVGRK